MTPSDLDRAAIVVALLLAHTCGVWGGSLACSQDDADPATVLWSARACVGEVGWRDLPGCRAVTAVHRRRARLRHTTTREMTRLYSAALRSDAPRPWVRRLRLSAGAPAGWPAASWPLHRRALRKVLGAVRSVLVGGADPCPEVLHYGSAADGPPGPGWERDETCAPRSRQRFWRRRGDET